MFGWFRRWRERRILARHPIDERDWQAVLAELPLLAGLNDAELARLRRMAVLFMHDKHFVGTDGLVMTGNMALMIALQACLPVLNLGLHWYRGWQTIIVYPTAFRTRRTQLDEHGVAHQEEGILAGEAWLEGGVVLAWDDTEAAGALDGHNLVIHEFVHKLDMLDGDADGFPPISSRQHARDWTESFTAAYEDLCRRVERDEPTEIDPYGATHPAEFVAVTSEAFFEIPHRLRAIYPDVYRNYVNFYRQDPAVRLAANAPNL